MNAQQAAVMAVLDKHRWNSMGVSTVLCECGKIMHADGSEPILTTFPADKMFREHVTTEVLKALHLTGREAS